MKKKECCGIGFGFLICKVIVEVYEGCIWVESVFGVGIMMFFMVFVFV